VKKFYNSLNFNHLNPLPLLQHWLSTHLPCPLCAAPAQPQPSLLLAPLCTDCASALPWYLSARCPQCALPTTAGAYCGVCLQHPPAFDRTLAPLRYAYPLDRLLQRFKYHQQLPLGKLLAQTMLPQLTALAVAERPEVMLAMPMHPHRVRQRGFNHALELARQLQPAWQIPLVMDGCARILDTQSQAGMDMKTRTRNLRGAFATPLQWQGKHVLIVDDVMTTGASMHALAKVLKRAGAGRITALVIARTLKTGDD
jgi:ComF family protein